jgi:uncharacterized membrane protein
MTKFQKFNVLSLVAMVAMVCFGLSLKGALPEMIPTKFDETGMAIKYAPIVASIFFLPIVAGLTVFFLTYFVKKNTTFWAKESNQVAVAQTNFGIVLLLAAMYVGTFLNALNYNLFFKYSFFAIGFGVFFLLSAGPMKVIEQNLLYGVRLPWTLTSHTNWRKTHELTSRLMFISGALLIAVGFFTRNHTIILSLVSFTFFIPTIYSFKMRKTF